MTERICHSNFTHIHTKGKAKGWGEISSHSKVIYIKSDIF